MLLVHSPSGQVCSPLSSHPLQMEGVATSFRCVRLAGVGARLPRYGESERPHSSPFLWLPASAPILCGAGSLLPPVDPAKGDHSMSTERPAIGFIGLGLMGSRMATWLLLFAASAVTQLVLAQHPSRIVVLGTRSVVPWHRGRRVPDCSCPLPLGRPRMPG